MSFNPLIKSRTVFGFFRSHMTKVLIDQGASSVSYKHTAPGTVVVETQGLALMTRD